MYAARTGRQDAGCDSMGEVDVDGDGSDMLDGCCNNTVYKLTLIWFVLSFPLCSSIKFLCPFMKNSTTSRVAYPVPVVAALWC